MIFPFFLLFIYVVLLFVMAFGYLRYSVFRATKKFEEIPISLIICARNEEKTISLCLKSIIAQEYRFSIFQVILVDDASSDKTFQIAKSLFDSTQMDFEIIQNKTQLGKKASITRAIEKAKYETIITRDADTYTTSNLWLRRISEYQSIGKYDLIIGPVALSRYRGLLWALQSIENNLLSIFSVGTVYFKKPFLCSGANLIFTKKIFYATNGYQNHIQVASGDDVLFLEDVKKIKGSKIAYLKSRDGIVYTYCKNELLALLQQKIRWAKKFRVNPNPFNLLLSLLVFSVNLLWVLAFIAYFLHWPFHNYLLLFLFSKVFTELFLLFLSNQFMPNKTLIWYALPVSIIYPFYTLLIAILSLFLNPKWK